MRFQQRGRKWKRQKVALPEKVFFHLADIFATTEHFVEKRKTYSEYEEEEEEEEKEASYRKEMIGGGGGGSGKNIRLSLSLDRPPITHVENTQRAHNTISQIFFAHYPFL